MDTRIGISLGLGACVLMGAVPALGQTGGPADRFLADYDLNHDGKVTRDELTKAQAARFSAAAHGGAMSQDQFAAQDMARFQQHMTQAFRRLDWNEDGKLSLDEYAGPQRVRFAMFDRDGKNAESCTDVQKIVFKPGRHSGFGRARFCADNDLNRDGSVTHAEFDNATAKHFAALSANAKTMSVAQFSADALAHWKAVGARFFRRMDANHDGALSLAEFSAFDQMLFGVLDRNKDGAVAGDELNARSGVSQKRG